MSETFTVSPGGVIKGEMTVLGDKSISHRAIMLGALAEGTTCVNGFLEGEDALATLNAFRAMGVSIAGPDQGKLVIEGVGLYGLKKPEADLYLGNAGTAMRLMAGLMAAQAFDSRLTGDASLSNRPMKRIVDPLKQMGAAIEAENNGRPPLSIKGGLSLSGINYTLPMASAQVKSCLLLAGMYAKGETKVTEAGVTRDHTERMLRAFGYSVTRENDTITIKGQVAKLKATTIDIPGDISSAAFFMVAASILPMSDIFIKNVGVSPTRDGVITILKRMGANITLHNQRKSGDEPVADIHITHAKLKGIDIPEALVPLAIDEFPILFIAAACAIGTTRLTGAQELRHKESDRILAMAKGLTTLGIKTKTTEDGIEITGGALTGGTVDSMDDHRIAMAFAIAAARASSPVTITQCENVATSFPDFVQKARAVGINIKTDA